PAFLEALLAPLADITNQVSFHILEHENHGILSLSQAVLMASGTVTLEAALYHTPMVIAYRLSKLGFWFYRRFSRVPFIGLPNVLSGEKAPIVPELLRERVTPDELADNIRPYLSATPERATVVDKLHKIQKTLGSLPASWNVFQNLRTEWFPNQAVA